MFAECIAPEDTVVVDRHAEEKESHHPVRYGSTEAERFQAGLRQFLRDLEEEPLAPYRAGAAVATDSKQVCALVEEADDQRTVLFGSNENEVSETMQELESELEAELDHAVVFSTDTHHSMHDLAARRQVDPDRIRAVVDRARDRLGPAEAGIATARVDDATRLLGTEYYALMYTINYVLRSFTVSLVFLYSLLVLLLLF